jgi:hypothetical protein
MTRLCSACLQKLLTKQLGFPVIAENDIQTEKGELVGVSMNGRNLTVIINVENSIFPERFRCMGWIKRLEFMGELPFGCVKSVTSKGREAEP